MRIRKILDASEKAGVTFDLDGRGVSVAGYEEGNFIGPTILSGVKEDMSCYAEEIFGPVLCCINVATLDEAIALVNRNAMGNGAQFACFTCFTRTKVQVLTYCSRLVQASRSSQQAAVPPANSNTKSKSGRLASMSPCQVHTTLDWLY